MLLLVLISVVLALPVIGGSYLDEPVLILSAMGGVAQFFLLIWMLPWLYFAFMESGVKQSTLGKRWLGMKVVNENGQRISFGLASGRFFAKNFLSGILLIGFLMALFTEKRQALHDKMAETLVIYSGGR